MFPSYHLSSTPDINIPIPEAIPGPDPFLEIRIAHAPAPQEDKLQVTIIDHRDQTISVLLTSDISTTHSAVNSINALGSPFRPADPRTNYRHYMQQFYARLILTLAVIPYWTDIIHLQMQLQEETNTPHQLPTRTPKNYAD